MQIHSTHTVNNSSLAQHNGEDGTICNVKRRLFRAIPAVRVETTGLSVHVENQQWTRMERMEGITGNHSLDNSFILNCVWWRYYEISFCIVAYSQPTGLHGCVSLPELVWGFTICCRKVIHNDNILWRLRWKGLNIAILLSMNWCIISQNKRC